MKINPIQLGLIALMCFQQSAKIDVAVLDADKTTFLEPQAVIDLSKDKVASDAARQKYDILEDDRDPQGYDPAKDETQHYEKRHPFGEIREISITGGVLDDSLKALTGIRQRWAPINDSKYREDTEEVWHWKAQKGLTRNEYALSPTILTDRYSALLTVPSVSQDKKAEICLFDKAIGVLWRKAIPLQAAFDAVKGTIPVPDIEKPAIGRTTQPVVMINKAGTRLLAMIPFTQPRLTLLFIYNNEGDLLTTSVLRERLVNPHVYDIQYSRAPDGERFRFEFRHDYDESSALGNVIPHYDHESDFIDANGNLLGRFVSPPKSSFWMRYSKDGKLAYGVGGFPVKGYIYELPNK